MQSILKLLRIQTKDQCRKIRFSLWLQNYHNSRSLRHFCKDARHRKKFKHEKKKKENPPPPSGCIYLVLRNIDPLLYLYYLI